MFAYIIGSVFGIAWVASGRSSIIPFGPFLSIGLMLALAFGPAIASQLLS
ncbi:MAG TPA: hypothetical protein PK765_03970 [bacterium]|nr:hypothetical protein [bacterium]